MSLFHLWRLSLSLLYLAMSLIMAHKKTWKDKIFKKWQNLINLNKKAGKIKK